MHLFITKAQVLHKRHLLFASFLTHFQCRGVLFLFPNILLKPHFFPVICADLTRNYGNIFVFLKPVENMRYFSNIKYTLTDSCKYALLILAFQY